jgi:hypothetical protein
MSPAATPVPEPDVQDGVDDLSPVPVEEQPVTRTMAAVASTAATHFRWNIRCLQLM